MGGVNSCLRTALSPSPRAALAPGQPPAALPRDRPQPGAGQAPSRSRAGCETSPGTRARSQGHAGGDHGPACHSPCPDGGGREDPLDEGRLVGVEAEEVDGGVDADEDAEGVEGPAAGREVAGPPRAQPHEEQVVDAGGGGGQGDPWGTAPRGRSVRGRASPRLRPPAEHPPRASRTTETPPNPSCPAPYPPAKASSRMASPFPAAHSSQCAVTRSRALSGVSPSAVPPCRSTSSSSPCQARKHGVSPSPARIPSDSSLLLAVPQFPCSVGSTAAGAPCPVQRGRAALHLAVFISLAVWKAPPKHGCFFWHRHPGSQH